jgi:preprotein translocase subunit SecG
MSVGLTIVHIAVCFFLVVVVLLQTGKGADMGAVFGGSSQTLFGSGGAGNFLTRLTTGAAVVFMVTSLSLSYLSTASLRSSVFDSGAPEPPPLEAPADLPPLVPPAAAPAEPAAAEPEAAAVEGAPEAAIVEVESEAAVVEAPAAEPEPAAPALETEPHAAAPAAEEPPAAD